MKDEKLISYRLYSVRDKSKCYVGIIIFSIVLLLAFLSKYTSMEEGGFATIVLMMIPYGAVMILYLYILMPYSNWMDQKKNILYRSVPNGYLHWKQSMQVNLYIASSAYFLIWIMNMLVLDHLGWDAKGTCLIYGLSFLIVIVFLKCIFQKQSTGTTTALSVLIYPLPVLLTTIAMEMVDVFASISWLGIGCIVLILLVLGYCVFLRLCRDTERVWFL